MHRLASGIALIIALVALASAATAGADVTLGDTTQPSGATGACSTVAAQLASEPSTPFSIPAGGGEITQWQTNSSADTPGGQMIFYVLRPGGTTYTVVGSDTESLPSPLPAITTFPLARPIVVSGGEILGVVSSTSGEVCYWQAGSLPDLDALVALAPTGPGFSFAPGAALAPGDAAVDGAMNVAATLVVAQDAEVSAGSSPAHADAGEPSLLASTVSNHGPSSAPISFTETVSPGLTIDSAVAGSGVCGVNGQRVACTVSGLAPGQSAPVDVVVTPAMAGRYTSPMSVTTAAGFPDPNLGNDTASDLLVVRPLIKPVCAVPSLRGIGLAAAKRLLRSLGCTLGKVRRVHSGSVARGAVIRTAPRAGTYATGTAVALQVSSGPRTHRHRA